MSAPVLPGVTQVAEWGLPVEEDGMMLPEIVEVYEEDAAVYGGGQEYPGVLAEVSGDGMLRQQRVVGVSVYPVQYDAGTQELTVYETMTVTVRFTGDISVDKFGLGGDSEAYEQLLSKQLLNYETARGYREATEALPSLQVDGASVDAAVDGITPEALVPWAPPEPGWRVKVQETGLYQLTYAELAGKLPVDSLDPQTLQMYNLGEEIAIEVMGEGDGSFDAGDYIVFYGEGIESKYTRDNVYWLTYGNGAGLRMGTRDGTPGGAGAAVSADGNGDRRDAG